MLISLYNIGIYFPTAGPPQQFGYVDLETQELKALPNKLASSSQERGPAQEVALIPAKTRRTSCHLQCRKPWSCWSVWDTQTLRHPQSLQVYFLKFQRRSQNAWANLTKWSKCLQRGAHQRFSKRPSEYTLDSFLECDTVYKQCCI